MVYRVNTAGDIICDSPDEAIELQAKMSPSASKARKKPLDGKVARRTTPKGRANRKQAIKDSWDAARKEADKQGRSDVAVVRAELSAAKKNGPAPRKPGPAPRKPKTKAKR